MNKRHINAGKHQADQRRLSSGGLTDEDIYLMMMLHTHQNMSCGQIARRFGISQGKAYDIIARRSNSGCCG